MGCCDKHGISEGAKRNKPKRVFPFIYPEDGCVLCAEKHISAAFALAGEAGYVAVNRQRIIGELTACALHLYKEHKELAEKVRAARHLIQQRREAEVDWHPLLTAMDWMATAAANENVKPEEST